ncbi:MAG: DUF1566 domain-containing protein, partial [Spirochaetota bacterium]
WSDLDEISDMLDNNMLDNKAYNLRDRGPAGGWIFHIVKNGDGTTTYYEAAPVDQEKEGPPGVFDMTWGRQNIDENGEDSSLPPELTGIGDGKTNSRYIYEEYAGSLDDYPAFQACYNYTGGGYTDWFLPSKDELEQMCWILNSRDTGGNDNPDYGDNRVGGFDDDVYWSSSEGVPGNAFVQSFTTGYQAYGNKEDHDYRVRAVRAFTY